MCVGVFTDDNLMFQPVGTVGYRFSFVSIDFIEYSSPEVPAEGRHFFCLSLFFFVGFDSISSAVVE